MTEQNSKPVLIFDGDCGFCRLWIQRWESGAKGRVEYRTSQEVAQDHPDIPATEFQQAVQWVDGETRSSGAKAIFQMLAVIHPRWASFWKALIAWGLFMALADFGYGMVAKYRYFFSRLVRVFHGSDLRPATYGISQKLFLRLIAVIYAIALLSFFVQADGLVGEKGITPAVDFFKGAEAQLGGIDLLKIPSIFWWGAGDLALKGWALAGVGVCALVFLGVAPLPGLFFLWVLYLSICVAGQGFFQFQWDMLLLEAGFLSIFLAPVGLRVRGQGSPPRLIRWLMIWLLFRLIFLSGIVKLTSGDLAWAEDGSALAYHFFTQPLPTPLAWYANQMPQGLLKWASHAVVWGEIILPFFLFGPRRVRLFTGCLLIAFQICIALTGNYGFFNLLSAALCVWVIDDRAWRRVMLNAAPSSQKFLPKFIIIPATLAIFLFTLVPFLVRVRWFPPYLYPLAQAYESVAPLRSFNGYGLFAVMTKERLEIIVQGSDDGYEWKTYSFRYKPGDPARALPWVAPHMPRLDWQMWFAALGTLDQNTWFAQFAERLLQASPPVLALLENDPFQGKRPKYIRALVDRYEFTTREQRNEHGDIWRTEPVGVYLGEVQLERQ